MPAPSSDQGQGTAPSSDQGNPSVATSVAAGTAAPLVASSDAASTALASSTAGVVAPSGGPYATTGNVPPLPAGADLGLPPPGFRWQMIHLVPTGVAFQLVPS